jgi:hypothetical protein
MEGEEPKGFQVRDRRRFTETGEAREPEGGEAEPAASPSEAAGSAASAEARAAEPGSDDVSDRPHLEITLSTFLMSLSTQALMCLGEIPNPVTGETEKDLGAVRELIDIIAMLETKTRGNVDPAEARLFEKILFDLRMRFVERARK